MGDRWDLYYRLAVTELQLPKLVLRTPEESFILFHYDPKYLYDVGLEHTITNAEPLLRNLSFSYKKLNEIYLDGGNVVKSERKAITTDFLCKYNPGFRRSDLRKLLLSELRADKIIIIPHEPYDYTGHADGMVRFLDESHVLVNDYKGYHSTLSDRLIKTLNANKLIPVAFPYHPSEKLNKAGDYTAIGNYMNRKTTTDHEGIFKWVNGGSPPSSQRPTRSWLLNVRQEISGGTSITGWQ